MNAAAGMIKEALLEGMSEAERFRLLVEAVTDYAIYMLDPNGIVTSWNTGAERIKGYKASEILGCSFSDFYEEADRKAGIPQQVLEIAARDGKFQAEGWRVRKDGTRFWANVVIDAIREPSGRLVGFAKITRDITERREAQFALDRTREALMHSQKIEAIGKLTGGVAHDFNNLLTVVLGSLDLLRRYLPNDDPRITRLLDNALQGAQRGATLTQRMLAFARRQELDLEAVDVVELTRGMRDLLQRSLGPQITIETRFPLALDNVTADPHQLETSLLNLAVNARDAMPGGGILTIAARNEATVGDDRLRPGRYVRLTLRDTGEGMDAETLARATEPFFTTKGTGNGTGLGLSMVHGMVEQLGGQLLLHSKPGEGTTAELWLPAAERPAGTDDSEEPTPAIGRMQPLTILAVDDDALVLANTRAMLEDLGHIVVVAYSGEQALEQLERTPTIELVITDHAMPRMTGSDLAKRILARRPDLPVILATGYAELPIGADASLPRLSKPYRQDALGHAVTNAVRSRRQASPWPADLDATGQEIC